MWFGLFCYGQNRTILVISNICNNIHNLLRITLLHTSSLLTPGIIPIPVQMKRQYPWLHPFPEQSMFSSCGTANDCFRTETEPAGIYSPIRCSRKNSDPGMSMAKVHPVSPNISDCPWVYKPEGMQREKFLKRLILPRHK